MGYERLFSVRGAGANRVFGFTLIEMAIMLTIFGVLLAGGVEAIRVQTAKRKVEQGAGGDARDPACFVGLCHR